MITNERQYRSTRAQLDKMRQARLAIDAGDASVPAVVATAQKAALDSQVEELAEAVDLYDRLRSGEITDFEADGLQQLPDILIQARIARGMSQKELGEYIGVKEQQIQRYEAERYRSASLDRLVEVADALGIHIHKRAELLGSDDFGSFDPTSWASFPVSEMAKRGWFEDFTGTPAQARKAASTLVPSYLANAQARYASAALHRKSVRASGVVLEAALSAWEARIRQLADRDPPEAVFDPARIDDAWVAALVALTLEPNGAALAVTHLRSIGISLVVERHLPGTLLDGAAMTAFGRHAIVGLTLRHDRLDNFWFTLLHEIGHLKLHIDRDGIAAIFDDTESAATDEIEREADVFAQEALLPADNWKAAASRFTRTEQAVASDAKRFKVGQAVIAGRVRREARDYTLLRNLVGAGDVRRQFGL
ncbi:MAG: hypothetical protein JWL96_1698 [Sphingomonas bacterium]|uniref:helix-turn-helix domain-containing protein n=1 Tax=Sphingomonas bacterium TaxID=1895847 RepID=UPI0026325EBD|nr:XRE family transcriptional regulator [Sphingomonas bacterium]MDB5709628.1 hypothetical protein [Sphingomonas bacterium]